MIAIRRIVTPLLLAIVLFTLNNLALIGGWLLPPDGYVPMLMVRTQDIALYLGLLNGYLTESLAPTYAAPWLTPPAFFNSRRLICAVSGENARTDGSGGAENGATVNC